MEKLLTPDRICEMLDIEKSTLYSWTRKELIPYIKVNGLLRFKEDDITKWLKMKERGNIIVREVEKFLTEIQERRKNG